MSKEYLAKRMSEFEEFKKKVKNEGSPLIKIALNNEWFDNVKEGAAIR